jgi:23S rRNA (uracil1939-C5)-methyltransferase
MARYGLVTGETMVVLITRTPDLPNKKVIIEEIHAALQEVKSIVQNVNTKKTNVIFGDETRLL